MTRAASTILRYSLSYPSGRSVVRLTDPHEEEERPPTTARRLPMRRRKDIYFDGTRARRNLRGSDDGNGRALSVAPESAGLRSRGGGQRRQVRRRRRINRRYGISAPLRALRHRMRNFVDRHPIKRCASVSRRPKTGDFIRIFSRCRCGRTVPTYGCKTRGVR